MVKGQYTLTFRVREEVSIDIYNCCCHKSSTASVNLYLLLIVLVIYEICSLLVASLMNDFILSVQTLFDPPPHPLDAIPHVFPTLSAPVSFDGKTG